MERSAIFGLGLLLTISLAVQAADLKSGPQVGAKIGAYSTKKCNTAADGVPEGQSLCYT
jgi:hypothetical protein